MHGWAFVDEPAPQYDPPILEEQPPFDGCASATACMVNGPGTPPLGSGSAELSTSGPVDGKALVIEDYGGTRLDAITELRFATYRQSGDSASHLAVSLQLSVDYDLNDQQVLWPQGRLVFQPDQAVGGAWQSWDAKAGLWWGTSVDVFKGGVGVTNPCVEESPCTWAQLLAEFPNLGVSTRRPAVVLKAGPGWVFRGNVDSLSIGINGATTIFDFESTDGSSVPALPPDTLPAWVHADSNVIDGGEILAGPLAKNAIVVAFEPTATQAQRESAVAAVSGVVIGGFPTDTAGGFYFVRPQNGETAAQVMAAAEAVNGMPGVVFAAPDLLGEAESDYRKPKDGATARDWQIRPDSADGDNWALEKIAAPSAWGCSIGDSATRIAVIDHGFHDVADLQPNVQGAPRYSPVSIPGHGTSVASIIGAKADNGTGIAGVMWKADLRLYERDRTSVESTFRISPLFTDIARMVSATLNGARVINISGHVGTMHADSAGRAAVEYQRRYLRFVLRLRDGSPRAPLFVLSAGNAGQNAYYNGYPAVALDYPSRVLVVTAAAQTGGGLYPGSNFGPQVHIAAPGEHLQAIDQTGAVTTGMNRTSGATPYVAGVAGLLASFDPDMSVNEIRDFIVAGALIGGRTAGGVPLLNAYESLKLAAQRVGSPLCGNRVYKSGTSIIALRGVTEDHIISLAPETSDSNYAEIDAYHGGKRIDLGFRHAYVWEQSSRRFVEKTPYQFPADLVRGGMHLSSRGIEHDGVFTATTVRTKYSDNLPHDTAYVQLLRDSLGYLEFLRDSLGNVVPDSIGNPTMIIRGTITLPLDRPTTRVLVGRSPQDSGGHWNGKYVDTDSSYIGTWSQPRVDGMDVSALAMAPSGKYAIVAVNFVTQVRTVYDTFTNCTSEAFPDFPPQQCRFGTGRTTTDSAKLYRMELGGVPNTRVIKHLPGVEVEWLAISELEDEIAWQSVHRADSVSFRYASQTNRGPGPWYTNNADSTIASAPMTCQGRVLEYRAFDRNPGAANPIGASKSPFPRLLIDGCDAPQANFAGTIAPNRGTTNGALMPNASKPGILNGGRVARPARRGSRRLH